MRRLAALGVFCLVVFDAPACSSAGSEAVPRNGSGSGGAEEPAGSGTGQDTEEEDHDPSVSPEGGSGTLGRPAFVTRVIDGDTIEVRFRGGIVDVRLIGIDTPETVHPTEPVECFGPAASQFTEREVEGEQVRLEFDVKRFDRYGRTLAYVWIDGVLFNERLVARGFAQVSTYPPNVKYVDRFLEAQREARRHDRGLWGGCPTGSSGGGTGTGGGGTGNGNCDPSYPNVCIAPYPPDLDCADVPYTNFEVIGSDPHGFDGDADGVGCET